MQKTVLSSGRAVLFFYALQVRTARMLAQIEKTVPIVRRNGKWIFMVVFCDAYNPFHAFGAWLHPENAHCCCW
ncbi:hypothetical protein COO20_03215 [Thalassospira marina]|uniref:Uncharacterized protein n=1 Tax=Thalassospira marina TaxID=2048283 RepID=A0A2N3KXI2_9PROT|nr:hypothetical protein COO20_03215 [Thalassospira marina]